MGSKLYHIRYGLREDIPICCILRWVFHRGFPDQAVQRGLCYNAKGPYVPCLIFHQAHCPFYEHKEAILGDSQGYPRGAGAGDGSRQGAAA